MLYIGCGGLIFLNRFLCRQLGFGEGHGGLTTSSFSSSKEHAFPILSDSDLKKS
jgi:hypothetical protein